MYMYVRPEAARPSDYRSRNNSLTSPLPDFNKGLIPVAENGEIGGICDVAAQHQPPMAAARGCSQAAYACQCGAAGRDMGPRTWTALAVATARPSRAPAPAGASPMPQNAVTRCICAAVSSARPAGGTSMILSGYAARQCAISGTYWRK